jgi:cell division protein FtsW (lipid II flippase)
VRKYFLASLLFLLMVLALVTLKSIAPALLNIQLIAYLLGFLLFFLFGRIPFAYWWRLSPYFYWGLNFILLLLLIWGQATRGIVAWIELPFGLRFQPSQLAVPITALFLSAVFKEQTQKSISKVLTWPQLIRILGIILLPGILINLQPDFGTAMVYFAALLTFLFFNRLGWQRIVAFISLIVVTALFAWFFVLADYQKSRFTSFLFFISPERSLSSDFRQESSAAYNARQSVIAVGAGQFWGQGVGQGTQSHLKFLPERQTDFIFASFVEEWGFLGSLLILTIYFSLLAFILYIVYFEENRGKQLYALSIFMMFLVQTFINIGMNLALLPITGITLPFLSYGGSSVLALFFSLTLFQSMILEGEKAPSSIFQ